MKPNDDTPGAEARARIAGPFPATTHSRRLSQRAVLQEIVAVGPVSRAEIARRTGLSKQTTSEVMRDLLEDDWVREVGLQRGQIGRSATNYELNGERAYVWGGDLGGTNLRVAFADLSGTLVAEGAEPTDPAGGQAVVDQIVRLIRTLARDHDLPAERIFCGGLGVPGAFDRTSGRLSLVSNLAGLDRLNLEAALGTALDMPVFVENDVTLAAKGEIWQGKPRETETFAFLAMGTGVGLGLVSDGHIVRGAHGAAGEIAWLPIAGDPFDSRNHRTGTLETAISSAAILERYRAAGGAADITMIGLFDRLADGCPKAAYVLGEVARALAAAIVAIRALFDPEVVIFGGSIGARPELLDLVRKALEGCMPDPVALEPSCLGNRAGQMGAISMALDHFRDTLFGDLRSSVPV